MFLHYAYKETDIENGVYRSPMGWTGYFKNGVLHNENGPAIVCEDGREEYWLDGLQLTREEYKRDVEIRKKSPNYFKSML